jgi:hypothetical protein
MATATKRVMVTAMRVPGGEEGNGNGGKNNGNGIKGGGQETVMGVMVMRVAGKQRQLGQWRWQRQCRGQWQRQ